MKSGPPLFFLAPPQRGPNRKVGAQRKIFPALRAGNRAPLFYFASYAHEYY